MWLANAVEGLAEQSAEPLKMQRDWRRAMQIDDAREFIKFLHGAVPWNGTWFGEYAPGERGAYWWRKHLDEAIAAQSGSAFSVNESINELRRVLEGE